MTLNEVVFSAAESPFGPKFWADLTAAAVAGVISSLIGALVGASVAFRHERQKAKADREIQAKKDADKLRSTRAAAGNLAMFTLARIQNDVLTYNTQFLAPALARPAPWLYLPATNFETSATHRFDINSLAFLLQSKSPEILMKLALEEDRFHGLVDLIRTRSEFHDAQYPTVVAAIRTQYNNPDILSPAQLKSLVPPDFFHKLYNFTSDIQTLVDLGIKSSKQIADELRSVLLSEMPGEKIIGFSELEELARGGSPVMAAREAARPE